MVGSAKYKYSMDQQSPAEHIRSVVNRLEELNLSPNASSVRYDDFLKHLLRDRNKEMRFRSWIRGTKVVDGWDRPLIVYHGSSEYQSAPMAYSHFGTFSVARQFAGRIGGYFLRIINPVLIGDPIYHNLAGYLRELLKARIFTMDDVTTVMRKSLQVGGFSSVRTDQESITNFAKAALNDDVPSKSGEEHNWLSLVTTWSPEADSSYKLLTSLTPVLQSKGIDGFRYVNKSDGSMRSTSWIITMSDQCAPVSDFINL